MRQTIDVTIDAAGRDKGKTYRLTEMSAEQAEEWALRAFFGMAQGGVIIPEDVSSQGIPGLLKMGLDNITKIPWHTAKPLLDEMMGCVQSVQRAGVRRLTDTDIEEIATRLKLRLEVFKLHTGFLSDADSQTSGESAA